MNLSFRLYAFALTVVALSGCASQGKPPPSISLDEPVQANSIAPKSLNAVKSFAATADEAEIRK